MGYDVSYIWAIQCQPMIYIIVQEIIYDWAEKFLMERKKI